MQHSVPETTPSSPATENKPVAKKRDTSRRRNLTQLKILEAAANLFAERGYFDVSMRDIAAQAGLSLGLAYHYFASKEALLRALIQHMTDIWLADFGRYLRQQEFASLPEFLVEYLMYMRAFIQHEHPDYFRFYQKHIHLDNLPHLDFLFERVSLIQPFFDTQIEAAIRRGEIRRGVEKEHVAFIVETLSSRIQEGFFSEFLGMNMGLSSLPEEPTRQKVARLVGLFLQGILRTKQRKPVMTTAAVADRK